MNKAIITALKERAKEMVEDNYEHKLGDEEIYTICCELENYYEANERLYQEKQKLKEELKQSTIKCSAVEPDYKDKQIRMLTEIRDMLKRLEFEHKIKEVDARYTKWETEKKNAEWEMECAREQRVHMQSEYWNCERY